MIDADGFILPDPALLPKLQEEEEGGRHGGQTPKFIKIPPPAGVASWDDAKKGARNQGMIWLCPAYAADRPLGHILDTHFVFPRGKQYNTRGTRVTCAGDSCLFCAARDEVRHSSQVDDKTKRSLLRRTEVVYNALNLSDPTDHTIGDGEGGQAWRPALLSATKRLAKQFEQILEHYGVSITHPRQGAPIQLTRERTGPEKFNLETSAMVLRQAPLHQDLWPLCRHDLLWNLQEHYTLPTPAEQRTILEAMGLGRAAAQISVPSGPAGGCEPPHSAASPGYAPPAAGNAWDASAEFGEAPPAKYPAASSPQPAATRPAAPLAQPAPSSAGAHQAPLGDYVAPPYASPAQAPGAAAGRPPPPSYGQPPGGGPVASAPQAPPVPSYGPPPGAAASQAPQASGGPAPAQQRVLRKPLPEDVRLPEHRERCFGRYTAGERYCETCPDWIKNQCQPQTPGWAPEAGGDQQAVQRMMAQMSGG